MDQHYNNVLIVSNLVGKTGVGDGIRGYHIIEVFSQCQNISFVIGGFSASAICRRTRRKPVTEFVLSTWK